MNHTMGERVIITIPRNQHISKDITISLFIKVLFTSLAVICISDYLYAQTLNERENEYVKEAIITDNNLKRVLETTIVPLAKFNGYRAKQDMINMHSYVYFDSLSNEIHEDIYVMITVGSGLSKNEPAEWARLNKQKKIESFQANLGGIKFYIKDLGPASWFRKSNKAINLGQTDPNRLLVINDNFVAFIFNKHGNCLRLSQIDDYGCSWLKGEAVRQNLPNLPIVTLKDEERKLPVIDVELIHDAPKFPDVL